ncbi:CBS domain-containing protein [Desulfonema limicola]|uniref:CBS domain-containing protein n=1 Tax=Desulfonema limicola TaxID=45656 RepID=A0A975BC31_9BACT|nr:CBS domain-containing protein [Desulfonema limicola]QTA82510.1 CBS domain-containing protein [Desulfonema limicola]
MSIEIDTCPLEISDQDILEAMKSIPGYLDITTQDFKEVYILAYRQALERIKHSVRAGDIMTRSVISVKPDTPLEEVAEILSKNGISGVPVTDLEERILGMISEKDFLINMGVKKTGSFMTIIAQCLQNKGCLALPIRRQKAENIMTSPVVTVTEDTSAYEISSILTEKNINRVPVVNRENKLAGIITRTDIVKSSCSIGY